MIERVVFLTGNAGKAREASGFLGREVTARSVELPEVQSLDFEAVVRAKATYAARLLGETVLVEDSGLSMAAWRSFPGPLTRWLTTSVGMDGVCRMLDAFPSRRAQAVSALGLATAGGSEVDVLVAFGRVDGSIAEAPRGANGFGWDVIFVPDGDSRTFAEMSDDEKSHVSHRARSFAALRQLLGSRESDRPEGVSPPGEA